MRIPPAAIRWLVSATVAGSVTAFLFLSMTRLVSGEWLYEGLLRIFPLGNGSPSSECLEMVGEPAAVTIEGEIGYLESGSFVPIRDGVIVGGEGEDAMLLGRTSSNGGFEVELRFAAETPTSCEDRQPAPRATRRSRMLTLRAPGCTERRVPITPAWVPHRVILECQERERS